MLRHIVERRLSLRAKIWLLNLGCMASSLLAAAVCGVQPLGALALALLGCACLSSAALHRVLVSLESQADLATATLRRLSDGDFRAVPDRRDKLGEALCTLAAALQARSAKFGAAAAELIPASKGLQELIGTCQPREGAAWTAQLGEICATGGLLCDGVQEISRAAGQLTRAAGASTASLAALAHGGEGMVDGAEQLVRVEQQTHATLAVMVENIGQAKGSVVELAENAFETSSRIFDMDESIARVDRDAHQIVAIAQGVLQDARGGKLAVQSTLQGMVEIDRHSSSAARVIGGLSTKVENIGFILNVIKDVAEQTALLSLNAAIISAQAGIHGKGFAVVATEIKTLATRTRESVNQIAKVIEGVQSDTQLAVRAISTAACSITAGEALAHRSNDALEKIVAGVSGAAEQMAGIAGVAKAQAASSQVIREATERMSRTICEISAVLCFLGDENEQILGATEQVAALVGRLHGAIKAQGVTSGQMVGATGQLALRLASLEAACADQQEKAGQLSCALDRLRGAQGAGAEAARLQNLAHLAHAFQSFQQELAQFMSQADSPA